LSESTNELELLRREYKEHRKRAETLKRTPTWRRAITAMQYAEELPTTTRSEILAKSEAWQVAEDAWLEEDEGLSKHAATEVEYWWNLANARVTLKAKTLEMKGSS
jgi:hypothetical protein